MTPRVTWRAALVAAVVITLRRPATWVVALAGFLAGGGVLILAWPVVVLPTPSGLQNILGAPVATLAFGSPSSEFVRLLVVTTVTAAVVFVGGLVAGAWAERRGIAMVLVAAEEEGYTAPVPRLATLPAVVPVALIRLSALVPPLIVFLVFWPTLYAVTYHELILPEDLATALPLRVVEQLPAQLTLLLLVWGASDLAAALAVRRLIVERRRLVAAWALGWMDLLRRPYRVIPAALLGDLTVILAAGPALVASALAWAQAREALELAPDSPLGIGVTVLWVSIWLGCLVLVGFGNAFRASLITLEGARRA